MHSVSLVHPLAVQSSTRRKRNLHEEAYERILSAILDGIFLPRERIVASTVAAKLGMSKTPVRDALQQLKVQGYVTLTPGGGLIVKNYTPKELREHYELREVLECGAIELVTERVTEEQLEVARKCNEEIEEAARKGEIDKALELDGIFHKDLLYPASGNERLCSQIRSLRDHFLQKRFVRASIMEDWKKKIEKHKIILEAIRNKDPLTAREATRQHLKEALEIQLRWLQ